MSLSHLMQGVSVGLIAASAVFWFARPAPVIEVQPPSAYGEESVVSTEFAYNRFAPMPEFVVAQPKQGELLQRSVRRVMLPNGEPGIRVLLLLEPSARSGWI